MDSDDEYDAYDLSEFSAADFTRIDAATHEHPRSPSPGADGAQSRPGAGASGGPQIAVALESASDVRVDKAAQDGGRSEGGLGGAGSASTQRERRDAHLRGPDTRSPFEEYRRRGTLSVTDLVGPSWCEVQFDYGLRQGRNRVVADRPETFVSSKGKVIAVQKKVAEENEKIMDRGRSVHKELEREVHPEEVVVDIQTREEFWALRFVNMLSCLESLRELGFSREMPVFGTVQDQVVIGVIDEISLQKLPEPEVAQNSQNKRAPMSAPGTPRKPKKQREPSSPSQQSQITTFFGSPPKPSRKSKSHKRTSGPQPPTHELHLLDTKTRRSSTLPSDDDALASRMQLMLYRHLLSALLSPAFPFDAFWSTVQADPHAQLSHAFLLQSGLAREMEPGVVLAYPACLDDLADCWRAAVSALRVRGVARTLEIVYRTQPRVRSVAAEFRAADREAQDIARAIEESLREQGRDADLERAIAESLRDATRASGSGGAPEALVNALTSVPSSRPDLAWRAQDGVLDRAGPSLLEAVVESARPEDAPTAERNIAELGGPGLLAPPAERTPSPSRRVSRIIGRKTFPFDEEAMLAHVRSVLRWWRGERAPVGVDLEHSHRCFSCEYREGCEWREKKAKEAEAEYMERVSRRTEGERTTNSA
ncbi:exonuclease V [Gloeopeniophorella convolvens]|nr:exonuclease V [Gloeopeniophorella convolvens]